MEDIRRIIVGGGVSGVRVRSLVDRGVGGVRGGHRGTKLPPRGVAGRTRRDTGGVGGVRGNDDGAGIRAETGGIRRTCGSTTGTGPNDVATGTGLMGTFSRHGGGG